MRSYGTSKRKCASISSSPLLASVAESTVIFGPMRQVGCASASSGVASTSSSRVRPRNGPPDPVSTSESTCSALRPSRHWCSAECSLSTGSRRPAPRARAARASSPAATRLSLFARARSTPRSSAHNVAWIPAKPTTAFSTTSGCARSSSSVRSPPTCFSAASTSSSDVEPDAAAQSSSSGCASTISIAWRPIDPVAPRRATRFTGPSVGSARSLAVVKAEHEVIRGGRGEEQRVQTVEHAAVAAEQAARVLHLQVALQHRLEQIAGQGRDDDDHPEHERLPDRQILVSVRVERDERDEERDEGAADEPLPRLAG